MTTYIYIFRHGECRDRIDETALHIDIARTPVIIFIGSIIYTRSEINFNFKTSFLSIWKLCTYGKSEPLPTPTTICKHPRTELTPIATKISFCLFLFGQCRKKLRLPWLHVVTAGHRLHLSLPQEGLQVGFYEFAARSELKTRKSSTSLPRLFYLRSWDQKERISFILTLIYNSEMEIRWHVNSLQHETSKYEAKFGGAWTC
jgi:hypothetical protein